MAVRDQTIIRTTCPRDCYDSCGIAVVMQGNAIVAVRGDRDHPVSRGALCGKCALAYNGVWRDPAARLGMPLRRAGAKGLGKFREISWHDALAEIAERLGDIADRHGGEAIHHAHYTGTCSAIAGGFPMRFFRRLGATEIEPDTVCNNAGHVALDYLYGTSVVGFDPRTAADAAAILVWGCNPSASAPHAHKHWLAEAPGKIIVVDPIRHATSEAADIYLQPFPGSDAALAFAMIHVLARDNLVDRGFLTDHTLGWDELEPLLAGRTPDWGEAQTGVPAAKIEEAARVYGSGPALLWLGQGLQRQPSGGNVMRAAALLPAVTGNFGKPGAGFYYLNGKSARGIDVAHIDGAGPWPDGPTISHMDLADRLADRAAARALVCWNINIAASNPRLGDLRTALAREDLFTVAIDPFQTDTADYADIVLPAASFLEFDDLVGSYFHLTLSAQVKARDPIGQSLPNQEIFRRLAHEMGYDAPELFESDTDMLDHLMARSGTGLTFADLAARGTVDMVPGPVMQFADLSFPTPSGKIEIASARAEQAGHPRLPEARADARPAEGRLRLLSPASEWLLNSSYGNDDKIAAQMGPASVILNPGDAAARGLADGDTAEIANETGRLVLNVAISGRVPGGTALVYKSRWPKREGGANVNILNPGGKSDMGESTTVHGTEVRIARADV
ncbi:MAG: molybdopterin-containing oxidoreductase family protein [Alphaproteobacteria bacterium]